jgi:hypothetical protein
MLMKLLTRYSDEYGLDGRCWIPDRDTRLCLFLASSLALGPTRPHILGVLEAPSFGVKQQERVADYCHSI